MSPAVDGTEGAAKQAAMRAFAEGPVGPYAPTRDGEAPARPVEDRDGPDPDTARLLDDVAERLQDRDAERVATAPHPTNQAIDAAALEFTKRGIGLIKYDSGGSATGERLNAPYVRLVLGEVLAAARPLLGELGPAHSGTDASHCAACAAVGYGPTVALAPSSPGEVVKRLESLVDVVLRQESRLLDAIREVDQHPKDGARWLVPRDVANAYGEREYERGIEAGYEQGRLAGLAEGRQEHAVCELQELEVGEPTEYEVWRDALALAVDEGLHLDAEGASSRTLLARSRWFLTQLKTGPTVELPTTEQDRADSEGG